MMMSSMLAVRKNKEEEHKKIKEEEDEKEKKEKEKEKENDTTTTTMTTTTTTPPPPKASFVKLTRQTMSFRRHFSFSTHGHEQWKLNESINGYFKSGVNMMQMLSNGQSYGGKVELSLYARDVYSYDENCGDEYFCAAYKNGGRDVSKQEVINVSFDIGGYLAGAEEKTKKKKKKNIEKGGEGGDDGDDVEKSWHIQRGTTPITPTTNIITNNGSYDESSTSSDAAIDLFNPMCMIKGLRLVINEQYKVFVAQECADQLERGTHFDTAPLPWKTDVYACVDMFASWMYVVEKELVRYEWTPETAKIMHGVTSKYQQLKAYGDCAPEYVETEEWGHIVDSIQRDIMDEAVVNEQLMAVQILANFFFHTEYTVVADCYSTPRVFAWSHGEVEALYETITNSKEIYELSYTYHNDFLPIMEIVYRYNKWMGMMMEEDEEEEDEETFDAHRVRSIAQAAAFFVNDISYVVFEDAETDEENLKTLDELVKLGVCIKEKYHKHLQCYRSKRYHDMFQYILGAIVKNDESESSLPITVKFTYDFKEMADYTKLIVAAHGLDNVVCLSPQGHHMHSLAYNVFDPVKLHNPYNVFDYGDNKYEEQCKGKHVILNWASGFGIEAITRILGYEPVCVYLVDFKMSVGRECSTSIMDSLCRASAVLNNQRDAVKCHRLSVSPEQPTLRSIAGKRYKSQQRGMCSLTFTKYSDDDKVKEIIELFNSCVVSRLKRNNTFL